MGAPEVGWRAVEGAVFAAEAVMEGVASLARTAAAASPLARGAVLILAREHRAIQDGQPATPRTDLERRLLDALINFLERGEGG